MAAHTHTKKQSAETIQELPKNGLSRWQQISRFVAVSRETWRKLVIIKKAPQPIRLSTGCTVWKNEEVHRWLNDPAGFDA